MIVKCMMCRDGEGLIVGRVYAVIAYYDHGAYKILEEGRYLGNHINRFEVIHNDHTIYIEIEDNVGEKKNIGIINFLIQHFILIIIVKKVRQLRHIKR